MSKNPKRNASQTRADRFSQMSKQEEIIAEKKRLIEAKLKMMETDNITSSSQVALDNKLDQMYAILVLIIIISIISTFF